MGLIRTFQSARADIKREIVAQFKADAGTDPRIQRIADKSKLQDAAEHRADAMLDEFTRLAVRSSFWSGVLQSFVGSFFFALFIGVLYIVKIGSEKGLTDLIGKARGK